VGLMWLYVLGVVIQFFLGGLGVLGGRSMDAHIALGYSALHMTPILILLICVIGRLPRILLGLTFAFAVVAFLQPIWVTEFEGEILGALHVFGALVVFALAHTIAQRATHLLRAERAVETRA
jgi:hypothetical protein